MNKVIDFFEKYAEWLAMGVAGVFLLFMIWSYVIVPTDATIEVGTEKVLRGDGDPTVQTAVRQLQNKMNANSDIKITVPNFAEQFAKAIGPERKDGTDAVARLPKVSIRQDGVPGATIVGPGTPRVTE